MKAHGRAGIAPILKIGTAGEQYVASSTGPPVAIKIDAWADPRAGIDALKKE
jgi:hypothetical protein